MFQHLVESLPGRLEAVMAAKRGINADIWDRYVSQAPLKASSRKSVCFGQISVISIIALDEGCLKLSAQKLVA